MEILVTHMPVTLPVNMDKTTIIVRLAKKQEK